MLDRKPSRAVRTLERLLDDATVDGELPKVISTLRSECEAFFYPLLRASRAALPGIDPTLDPSDLVHDIMIDTGGEEYELIAKVHDLRRIMKRRPDLTLSMVKFPPDADESMLDGEELRLLVQSMRHEIRALKGHLCAKRLSSQPLPKNDRGLVTILETGNRRLSHTTWSQAEDDALIDLRQKHSDWDEIARRFDQMFPNHGRTAKAVYQHMQDINVRRRARGLPTLTGPVRMTGNGFLWTEEHDAELRKLHAELGTAWEIIATRLKEKFGLERSVASCRYRFRALSRSSQKAKTTAALELHLRDQAVA